MTRRRGFFFFLFFIQGYDDEIFAIYYRGRKRTEGLDTLIPNLGYYIRFYYPTRSKHGVPCFRKHIDGFTGVAVGCKVSF